MCKYFDVQPERGDILLIRTGVIPEWDGWADAQKQEYAAQKEPKHAGVEASIELLEWLWDSGISAVAGDAISWEVSPHCTICIEDFVGLVETNQPFPRLLGLPNARRSLNARVFTSRMGYAHR
jgi:kynurenine formamidase